MSKARLVITALFVEHQSPAEVAARYGVHRSWVYKLKARYEAEGEAAFEPRSRRPKTSPTATPPEVVQLIIALRHDLARRGLDAGPDTIRWHLTHHHGLTVSAATISRHLRRAGLVTPAPKKRPKSSYVRFEASLPNETWQSDFTHYRLTTGTDVEILTWLDDCTRKAIRVTAHRAVTAIIVRDQFRHAVNTAGIPASTLTDNGMVSPPSTSCREVPPPSASPAKDAAADATPSKPNCTACTSPRRTPDPATPPPAARSNAFSKR
ncbi:hypothetical protein HMPREF0063_12847 [Aeromicrobium marinum DSM 15272]|uniref:Integrase catalytic domain-containing protein n=1 Tax=Aeromicrobium marinum DSM 15272 TaxID=585531 RepID=E2SFN8_9ACTN|nr:helix-turn-helix domain-containing protein [Aeromicrobium marinum]EFQ82005.1 hypothetical protein HMPREF0063_12847 [Aeromicrobium marinum DSM 15272]